MGEAGGRKGTAATAEVAGEDGGAEKRAASNDATTGASAALAAPPPAKRAWRDQPHVGKYKLIRTLGSGNFAKVKLAQHITTKKEVNSHFPPSPISQNAARLFYYYFIFSLFRLR